MLPCILEAKTEPPATASAHAAEHRDSILSTLREHGAVLLRGFGTEGPGTLEETAGCLAPPLMDYQDRAAHRTRIAGQVFTSADYPPKHDLFLHNEATYARRFPRKLFLHCLTPARKGGETPIADATEVFARLDDGVVRRFAESGVAYVRNFGTGAFGPSWQDAFQTDDRETLEAYCRVSGIETEWLDDQRLRTRQVRPALIRHPDSGRIVWFNHAAALHVSTLPAATRRTILKLFDADTYPCNTTYGDGTPIEPEVLDAIRAAYLEARVTFDWRRGDLLMLDNLRVAHGRAPFQGPREVLAALAEPAEWKEMEVPRVDELGSG